MKVGYQDANMMKGGLTYTNVITTVSPTYAGEIQSAYYGENLDAHLRYHSGKLCGIINGIDYDIWNPNTDARLYANYDRGNVLGQKKENKRKLQEELGLAQDDSSTTLSAEPISLEAACSASSTVCAISVSCLTKPRFSRVMANTPA